MNATPSLSPQRAPARHVLITPARNEAAFIGGTIESVINQSQPPLHWVIVSDGSTDGTDEIVRAASRRHPWIELVRMPEHRERNFAAKVHCFNAGYARVRGDDYDYVGNLDADITLAPDHFAFLLARFAADGRLGVAGTPFVEDPSQPGKHSYAHGLANLEHVSGACQLFRRECFEAVGGYVPVKGGAIDWIAVTTARMLGWRTRTFPEIVCIHHRPIGTGSHRPLGVPLHYGRKAYVVGGDPLWALLRGCFEMRHRPWIIGGILFQLGFLWAMLMRVPTVVSPELGAFHRAEQRARLKALFSLRPWRRPTAAPLQA